MSLYDHDVGKSPELISQSFLSCKSVQEKAQAGLNAPSWVNFYRGKGQGNEPLEYCGRVLSSIAISIGEGKVKISEHTSIIQENNTHTKIIRARV
jgi:hypothetical protein